MRNGEPWIPYHISLNNNLNARSQQMPPYDRPGIRAFTSPSGRSIGNNYNNRQSIDVVNLVQGKYPWTVELINIANVPENLYFEVIVPMEGLYPNKMTHGIKIGKNKSAIDLGVIDFDVIRLWGNLPVTFNGNPSSANVYNRLYRSPDIRIMNMDGVILGSPIIWTNGNWVQDIFSKEMETSLIFILEAREKGGIFRKILNPNQFITVHNTDKEIIFFDYENVDFEAYTLSGTIEIITTREKLNWFVIEFYDDDNSLIALVDQVSWQIQRDDNDLILWETMIPAFSFPKELNFRTQYQTYSSIIINEETDLSNIFLFEYSDY
jgi:hypothetical protein